MNQEEAPSREIPGSVEPMQHNPEQHNRAEHEYTIHEEGEPLDFDVALGEEGQSSQMRKKLKTTRTVPLQDNGEPISGVEISLDEARDQIEEHLFRDRKLWLCFCCREFWGYNTAELDRMKLNRDARQVVPLLEKYPIFTLFPYRRSDL